MVDLQGHAAVIACPNLSLDRTIRTEHVRIGGVHRSLEADVRGGGKGINVARALGCLGIDSVVIGLAGGHTGRTVSDLLRAEGIVNHPVTIRGETRSCLTVLAPNGVTVFNESGPQVSDAGWKRFEDTVAAGVAAFRPRRPTITGGHFCLSGSHPPGAPDDAAYRLLVMARDAGCSTICDTSGPLLARALDAGPDLIKPNLSEALDLIEGGHDENVETGPYALVRSAAAARQLVERGPRAVVVSAGAAGAALATADETLTFAAPGIDLVNPVGAGDAMIAGIVAGLGRGETLPQAVRRGVATGAASCETIPAGMLDPRRAEQLLAVL